MRTIKKKSVLAVLLVAILATAGLLVYRDGLAKEAPAYRFVAVEKGNLQSKVSATGTLNAVTTVSVGTQVSGQVAELLVDYNDHVKKGQLLARIDPTLAQQAVADAQANVDKARAQQLEASREHARNADLMSAGLVARSAYEQTQSANSVAQADVRSAQISLERARQNLSYTNIYAPIDGVVVERNVQQGQTVAASLSAPQIFLIANDLTHMQILAQVGESDIARIKQGQDVAFSVQALPNEKFKGTVQQVRLQSTTSDNVVNYTVVVAVDNSQNKLLPGMTARVDFLTNNATDVLKVSNAALRYRPSDEQLAELQAARKTAATASSTTGTTGTSGTTGTAGSATSTAGGQRQRGTRGAGAARPAAATLYYLDDNGKLAAARVRTGISDGTSTEIQGRSVTAGMKVIAGTTTATTASAQTTTAASPFNSSSQQRPQGGPRGGF
jgi:HlyD family secretion protein